MTKGKVTRYEFGQLAAQVAGLDEHGSRGVAGLSVQVAEVIKDVAALSVTVDARFAEHRAQHVADAKARRSAFRWATGLCVAIVAMVDGPLVTILLAHR